MMRDEVGIPKYVWWDMASCEVPDGCDPGEIRSILESALVKSYGPGPLTIFAIGDSSRVPRHVLEAMSRSGIIIKLTGIGVLSMVTDFIWWVTKHTPPAILMVISDLESAYENLLVKFEAKGYTIARAYLNRPPKSLKYTCNEWFWESLLTQETTRQELQGKCNETAWHCNLCFRDGQGFEDFTRHLDSEEHAFKDLLLLPHTPSVSPHEDLEDQDPFRKWMKTVSERILKQLKELEEEQEERIARLETKRREKHVNALADPVTPESHLESCEQWKSRSASQAADIEACRNLLKYALRFYSLGRGLCDECCVVL